MSTPNELTDDPQPFSMFEEAKRPSRWLILGEAPGEEELKQGRPFVGPSGKLMDALLKQVGFDRGDFHILNVFSQRPPDNDLKKHWTLTKTDLKRLGHSTVGRLPTLNKRYIHPEHEIELDRLDRELTQLDPEFILMLGGTALWALTGEARITVNRGALLPLNRPVKAASGSEMISSMPLLGISGPKDSQPQDSTHSRPKQLPAEEPERASGLPSCSPLTTSLPKWALRRSRRWGLPSFHPAMVLRQWDQRPLLWADFLKSRRFLQDLLPEPLRRKLWLDPSFQDLEEVYTRFQASGSTLGCDIETDPRIGQITMISFGTPSEVICIPFWNKNTLPALANYWKTAREEAEAWKWVMRFAALPNAKVGQNFIYDHQYLLEDLDIRVRNINDDTAILQHAMQPELPKALGTLASVYLNEPSWKFMRESEKDVNKADD